MPKCLDCGNTTKFWYTESCTKLGQYDINGELEDVITDFYEDPINGECNECQSNNIEGAL